ncbi:hypothetical protein GCM10010271_08400 [Streptomyces kurssanovii]|nr:hypothetical protein GCM10010271_08400 [Streptomyces kurssanovii]
MGDPQPIGRDGANSELKMRLQAVLARQGLSQADLVRQTQLNGESVSKAAVSNALNPEKGPPAAMTLTAILNAANLGGAERDELCRLRARAGSQGTTQLEAYLEAAVKAASRHPYPGVLDAPSLPALADVYVRQQAGPPVAKIQDRQSPGDAAARGNQTGATVPAAEVFLADHDVCVLQGGPGGGKSTLLRAHLAGSAESRLGGTGRDVRRHGRRPIPPGAGEPSDNAVPLLTTRWPRRPTASRGRAGVVRSEPVQAVRGALGAEEGVGECGRARSVGPYVSGAHERARGGAAEVDRAQVAHVQDRSGSRSVATQSALPSWTASR